MPAVHRGGGAAGFARQKEHSEREGKAGTGLWWWGNGPELGSKLEWTGGHGRGLKRWGKQDFVHEVNNFEVWKRLVMATRKRIPFVSDWDINIAKFHPAERKGLWSQGWQNVLQCLMQQLATCYHYERCCKIESDRGLVQRRASNMPQPGW